MARVFIGVIHSYLALLLLFLGSIEQTKMTHFLLGKKQKERKGHGQMDTQQRCTLSPSDLFPPAKPHLLKVPEPAQTVEGTLGGTKYSNI